MTYFIRILKNNISITGTYMFRSKIKRMFWYSYLRRMGFSKSELYLYSVPYDNKGMIRLTDK